MKYITFREGKVYARCKNCGREYNISILKKLSGPFECPVCERKRRDKPVFNKNGIRIEA